MLQMLAVASVFERNDLRMWLLAKLSPMIDAQNVAHVFEALSRLSASGVSSPAQLEGQCLRVLDENARALVAGRSLRPLSLAALKRVVERDTFADSEQNLLAMYDDWLRFNNMTGDTQALRQLADLVRLTTVSTDRLTHQFIFNKSSSELFAIEASRIRDELMRRHASETWDERPIARLDLQGRVECAHRAFVIRDTTHPQGTCWHVRFGDLVSFNRVQVRLDDDNESKTSLNGEQAVSVHVSTTDDDDNKENNEEQASADWIQLKETFGSSGIFFTHAQNTSAR